MRQYNVIIHFPTDELLIWANIACSLFQYFEGTTGSTKKDNTSYESPDLIFTCSKTKLFSSYSYTVEPERIYNPIMAMGFSAMFTFQQDNTKS